jgi:hypothetical protein
MNKSEKFMEDILKELNISTNEPKIERIRILETESIKDYNYDELIGLTFIASFKCEDKVGIEYGKEILWFKSGEYEFVEG